MPSISFNNIVKKFGALTVVENLNLSIGDGDFLVLLGPSGCGKTTLLNLLAGLLEIDSGQIFIGERDVSHLDPKDRGLAMVFQSYALYPTKTVRGNMNFGLSSRGITRAEADQRIAWAAELLQIEHLLDRKPSQLSGGQRQRVAIGRALVKQYGVCLFDEPLSNLDAKLRNEMRIEIKKLHNQLKNTVVYVTHDQVEAMTMATKIAVMDKGVIQQFGTPDEIYNEPANLFVADFVGSPAMNLLDCTIKNNGRGFVAADETNTVEIDLGQYKWKNRPIDGATVKIGFRAEDLLTEERGDAGDAIRFDCPVEYFEKSGPDAFVFLTFSGRNIAVRIDGRSANRYRASQVLPIYLPLDKLNVFDAPSGQRL
ncbi:MULTISPECIES: ABC transporter ATP-binding protein [unclassified Rhizobium]|uniref:ABC transporter ATP-binding protein n=1 Tax=unclassified Rhizobium TaxID=2613769 RepID=UPI00084BF4B3|nr:MULTISPECIES: ABC transporter ATP-binding protein [unclassified Rhizobium]OEC95092.1 ABC transporter ATP-binding protein [Rhizobium sp. YK2]QYA16039.1 ABC transporter ATP-binding protein [Rhizobium sp. AB2/73]UEQ84582.1 ABC transporter ATP-binding protein [Rhizobium sp. AB2/73]